MLDNKKTVAVSPLPPCLMAWILRDRAYLDASALNGGARRTVLILYGS